MLITTDQPIKSTTARAMDKAVTELQDIIRQSGGDLEVLDATNYSRNLLITWDIDKIHGSDQDGRSVVTVVYLGRYIGAHMVRFAGATVEAKGSVFYGILASGEAQFDEYIPARMRA